MRSVANLVVQIIEADLARHANAKRVPPPATGDPFGTCDVGVFLWDEQRERLEALAERHGRSLSNYVGVLVRGTLG